YTRNYVNPLRVRRAGAEVHRDRESTDGFAAIGPAVGRILFFVQAGDLGFAQVIEFSFAGHAANETDSGHGAGAQRRRITAHYRTERKVEGSFAARPKARAQCA